MISLEAMVLDTIKKQIDLIDEMAKLEEENEDIVKGVSSHNPYFDTQKYKPLRTRDGY